MKEDAIPTINESLTPTTEQLIDLYRTTTDANVVRACLITAGDDAHFILDGDPSNEERAAATVIVRRSWNARNSTASEPATDHRGIELALTASNDTIELVRLRARWTAARPFVETAIELWNKASRTSGTLVKFDQHLVRAMLDEAISKLGALADTFTAEELEAPDLLGEALRSGRELDALLARMRAWSAPTEEEIDREPATSSNPNADEVLKMQRACSNVSAPTADEPAITDDEILDLYYIANRDNDPKVQTLCEVARGDGEVTRQLARQALAPLAAKRRAQHHSPTQHGADTIQVHTSPRGMPLMWMQPPERRPVLTIENYVKWYALFLVQPDGTVKQVCFDMLLQVAHDETPWCDHVPNPTLVHKLATTHHWMMDEKALELIIGRWEREYRENYAASYE